jgi:hypothetical protein
MVILFEGKVGAENRVLRKKHYRTQITANKLTTLIVNIKRNADTGQKTRGVRVFRPNNEKTFYVLTVETMDDIHSEGKCNFKCI